MALESFQSGTSTQAHLRNPGEEKNFKRGAPAQSKVCCRARLFGKQSSEALRPKPALECPRPTACQLEAAEVRNSLFCYKKKLRVGYEIIRLKIPK
jgi:hypothetical protein